MTLGGLALAVGVLVDEATVEIENVHTQLLPGVSRAKAVLEACRRTVIARLLSMLCVLAVFVPSYFMTGIGETTLCPPLAGRRLRNDRLLLSFKQPGAGIFDMVHEGNASRGGERRRLGAAPILV